MTNSNKSKKLDLDFNEKDVLKIKRKIRATEYYGMQETFDKLYAQSGNGKKFNNLMDIISSRENILLAYRSIKANTGGTTAGTDGRTIDYLKEMETEELVNRTKRMLENYQPKSVRRVNIPKANGKLRPLGIPCIQDRLVQQCIKQVLEPICEAKFNKHSYGFRPNRRAEHAILDFMKNVNLGKNHYVVDVDIKGFFDNVNHEKLIKQMWSLGIQDKNLIEVIKKCLKASISESDKHGNTIKTCPTSGTPQGGILSPLLSNIVLNELDWWVTSQWEGINTRHKYVLTKEGGQANKFRALRNTGLKEGYLIRYADDFKICCKTKEEATKWYHAVTQWLKERLGLDYAPDKSKITNLKVSSSEFLGLRFKLKQKGDKWVINSWMTAKAKDNMIKDLKEQIKRVQHNTTIKNVNLLNSKILGRHGYYKIATHINLDMTDIHFKLSKTLYNKFKTKKKHTKKKINGKKVKQYEYVANETYNKFYGQYNYKPTVVCGMPIFPIGGITHKNPMGFPNGMTPYSEKGRELIHKNLECVNPNDLKYIIEHPIINMSAEYNDNRISLFSAQWGACFLTGYPLDVTDMECHHKTPRRLGGTDKFANLMLVSKDVHKLIHATKQDTINKYLDKILPLIEESRFKSFIKRLNKYRENVGNNSIVININ